MHVNGVSSLFCLLLLVLGCGITCSSSLSFANASIAPSDAPTKTTSMTSQAPSVAQVASLQTTSSTAPSLGPFSPPTTLASIPRPSPAPSTQPSTTSPSNSEATALVLPSALPSDVMSNVPSAALPSPLPSMRPPTSQPSPHPTTSQPSKPPTCNVYDSFGVEMMYRDDPYKQNWDSNSWYSMISRNFTSPGKKTDPYDQRVNIRGSGTVIFQNGQGKLIKSPYLEFVGDRSGWTDVEFTGYANFSFDANPKANAGINIQLRSDHGLVSTGDGCEAQFYWAQINFQGKASFTKELYHDEETVVRSNKIVIDIEEFSSGLPVGEWIGVKFIAFTSGGVNVRLELLVDTSGGKNQWRRVATYKDRPGQWNTTKAVPSFCSQTEGDTILGPSRYCALFNVGRDESTQVTWKDVSIRNIIPEPLAEMCERPSSIPSTTPTLAPTTAPQSKAPTLAPQSNAPTQPPLTSIPSVRPSFTSTPTREFSEEPTIEPGQGPPQYPTCSPVVEVSQNLSATPSPMPSTSPSASPSASSSLLQILTFSLNTTAEIFFPGVNETLTESELDLFEETTSTWLQNSFVHTSLVIVSVEVKGQEVVFSIMPGARKLRRSQEIQGAASLAVKLLVRAEANIQEGKEVPSLSSFIDAIADAISNDSRVLRDNLSLVVSLFSAKSNGDISDHEESGENVDVIVGSVFAGILFVLCVAAVLFYRRTRCKKEPLAEVEEFSCSSSSIGSASFFGNGGNHPMKNETMTGSNADVGSHLYPIQELASQGSGILQGDDAESIGSGVSTSDFSELYALSSIGFSTDAGGKGGGLGTDPFESTAAVSQDLEGLIPPSSLANQLYPIISVSESGDKTDGTEEVAASDGNKVRDAASCPKDNEFPDNRMHHQSKSIEKLFHKSGTKDEDDSFGADDSDGDEGGSEEANPGATRKGSPIKTMFSCFQPQAPTDGVRPSTLTSSSILSVGSASSKSFTLDAPASWKSTEKYEIRAPAGSLGMVVVTSREGPRVYHVKDRSPLANIIEEGDIIVCIDGHDTRRMTASSLRRFLRSRDSQAERVIAIRGRKRKTDMESSSGDFSL